MHSTFWELIEAMKDTSNNTSERRRYYRINDVVLLDYEEIENEETSATPGGEASEEASGVPTNAASLLAEIDRELSVEISSIWPEHPTVAKALGHLNRKISVLAKNALGYEENAEHSYRQTRVKISGSGIDFEANEAFDIGKRLRLSMIIKPSQISISITGSVVSCEGQSDSGDLPYRVRVEFDEDTLAQEQVIQHVVQKQGALLSHTSTEYEDD